MIDSTLYLVGVENDSNDYVENARPCSMCKRVIINAGIKEVVIRKTKTEYEIIQVQEFVKNDESLVGTRGY